MACLVPSLSNLGATGSHHATALPPQTSSSCLNKANSSRASAGARALGTCCGSSALSSCSALNSRSTLRRPDSSSRSRLSAPKGLGLGQGLKPSPLSLPTSLPSSLNTPSLSTAPLSGLSLNPRFASHVTQAGRGGGDGDTVDATQRILASVGYLLPFLDGAKYGRYLYLQYPFVRALLDPVVPAIQLYNGLPFAGFIAFFALYLGIIQNQNMSRYVRYNVMQAVILDILMILPALLERVFTFRDGVGFQITIVCYNTVFLYLVACVLFGVGSCLLGRNPRLPLVADAAEAQVPF